MVWDGWYGMGGGIGYGDAGFAGNWPGQLSNLTEGMGRNRKELDRKED